MALLRTYGKNLVYNNMIGIILAAGIGKRLMPLTEHNPKTLVRIQEKTVLEHIVTNLIGCGIQKIYVVVGHKKESVISEIHKLSKILKYNFEIVENEDYLRTNTGFSLLKAFNCLKKSDDIVIINGDIVFDRRILKNLVECNKTSIVVDNVKDLTDESFKVKIVPGGRIGAIGKQLPITDSNGEFIGLSLIRKENTTIFKKILENLLEDDINQYYDIAFKKLSGSDPIGIVYTNGLIWTEIDYFSDLEYAKQHWTTINHN